MPCPACGSQRVRPSRPRGRREKFLRAWSQGRYYECRECHWRARRARGGRDGSNTGIDLRFWAVAALVGLGFLYVLYRGG
jgi:hypothetical protein